MNHNAVVFTAVIAFLMTLAGFMGCSENPVSTPGSFQGINPSELQDSTMMGSRETDVLGAYISIAWPFGSSENPDWWYGYEGPFPTYWTHTGADYYAQDLNRNNGQDFRKNIYAGFTGEVILACWSGNYGKCVVIYDQSRHVALRYAHLDEIGVSVGQWVQIRQYIGKLGSTGYAFGPHLHLVAYENVNDNNGNPIIPSAQDSNYYACMIYYFC